MHESNPQPVPDGISAERGPASPLVLRIPLPELAAPADPENPTDDLGERVNEWELKFKLTAENFLKQQGYNDAKVVEIESLRYTQGYDKDDYLLNIRVGTSGEGMIGEEGISETSIIVRRVAEEGL